MRYINKKEYFALFGGIILLNLLSIFIWDVVIQMTILHNIIALLLIFALYWFVYLPDKIMYDLNVEDYGELSMLLSLYGIDWHVLRTIMILHTEKLEQIHNPINGFHSNINFWTEMNKIDKHKFAEGDVAEIWNRNNDYYDKTTIDYQNRLNYPGNGPRIFQDTHIVDFLLKKIKISIAKIERDEGLLYYKKYKSNDYQQLLQNLKRLRSLAKI